MTIKLLTPRVINGVAHPVGAIVTLDAGTESGLIATKEASSDLTGGAIYTPPAAPESYDEARTGGVAGELVVARTNPLTGGIAFGIAPSGTIAADGTLTLGTALPLVFDGGLWLWFPAGAVDGGSAGMRWVVMSSTTVGVVYEGQGGGVVIGSGSAYTGVTSEIEIGELRVTGLDGRRVARPELIGLCSASTNAKTLRGRVGGSIAFATAISTAGHAFFRSELRVSKLSDAKFGLVGGNGGGTSYGIVGDLTDGDAIISLTLQLATATEYIIVIPSSTLVV